MTGTVLVIDDEPTICWAFQKMFEADGYQVITAPSAEEGQKLAAERTFGLILLDVRLPGEDGISALPAIAKAAGNTPVIVMTAFGELETAVSAIRAGACDYLTKPFSLEQARHACQKVLKADGDRDANAPITSPTPKHLHVAKLVGQSFAIQTVFKQIALVADSDLAVLITGETGTGKELVAAAIHSNSPRADKPYLPVSPVAFNPDLVESELFGHVQGAFTGATQAKAGVFEQADGGTVLLDEIGDLPIGVQVKLLRVLEKGDFCRVGDVVPRKCDVRIVAATNCNLQEAVKAGRFRADLFYRLNGLAMHLPPLRERKEDILPLCLHFLSTFGYPATSVLKEDLIKQLQQRDWHGNVRELKNAVEQAAVVARGRPLQIDDFPEPLVNVLAPESDAKVDDVSLEKAIRNWFMEAAEKGGVAGRLHQALISAAESSLLKLAVEHCGGNRSKAASLLGIHRGTLREKLREED